MGEQLRTEQSSSEIDRPEDVCADLEYELQLTRNELIRVSTALSAIKASTAWRITGPVRRLGDKTPRVAFFFKKLLNLAGQLKSTLAPSHWKAFFYSKNSHVSAFKFHTADFPDVSIIIPAYKHYEATINCLVSIAHHSGTALTYEVIVADDGVDEPIVPHLPKIPGLTAYVNEHNLGFLLNCNMAAAKARGRYLLFLNNDTLVEPDWLEPMVRLAEADPTAGMVGCKLLNMDGTIQDAGWTVLADGWGYPLGRNQPADKEEYNYTREVDCITGACFLIPKKLFAEIGGFDSCFAPAFYEEFDLAFTLRKRGYKVLYQPESCVKHLGSASYDGEARDHLSTINHSKFVSKWIKELRHLNEHPLQHQVGSNVDHPR